MSGDEIFVLIASILVGGLGLASWFWDLGRVRTFGAGAVRIGPFATALVTSATLLLLVLRTLAAPDVTNAPEYIALYFFLGLAWLRLVEIVVGFLGVSARDDAVERRNRAAVPVVAGVMLGAMCCYAGGNIGAGPGWWVVVFAAALATGSLVLVWVVTNGLTSFVDRVTIERDEHAGWRIGALLVASGLVLGRAVAGDWYSVEATVLDFARVAWPVVLLVLAAAATERASRAVLDRPSARAATIPAPALAYVIAAASYIAWLGWPV